MPVSEVDEMAAKAAGARQRFKVRSAIPVRWGFRGELSVSAEENPYVCGIRLVPRRLAVPFAVFRDFLGRISGADVVPPLLLSADRCTAFSVFFPGHLQGRFYSAASEDGREPLAALERVATHERQIGEAT